MTHPFLITGSLHFVGIGGIGMSGIAEVLHALGYHVTGSDAAENVNVLRLRGRGIDIKVGHDASYIEGADVVIISTDIPGHNPELTAARQRNIPVLHRAEMLAELMRLKKTICVSGTHGKTTTTSLCAALLDAAGEDPTVVNGGIINSYGTNARLGKGQWFVAEADESDGSFLKLPPTIAAVTNIDPEHMSYYKSFDNVVKAYESFIHHIPFYGLAILCADHPVVREVSERITDRRKVTYGLKEGVDIRAVNIRISPTGAVFDLEFDLSRPFFLHRTPGQSGWSSLKDFILPMHGEHNVQNTLVTVALALELGFSEAVLRKALQTFSGVKRRFTKTGEARGVTVIDDYAHHPVEIAAVLKAARNATKRQVITVIQPHRYSRLADLFHDFVCCLSGADSIVVCPIYSAGETPLPGVTQEAFFKALKEAYPSKAIYSIAGAEELPSLTQKISLPGDLVLCLGAGSITQWAQALPSQLMALENVPSLRKQAYGC